MKKLVLLNITLIVMMFCIRSIQWANSRLQENGIETTWFWLIFIMLISFLGSLMVLVNGFDRR